ncbi:MAG: gliding motility-associated C-terminal domain-containing protein [Saprospiraceae bacterium]
MKITVNIRSVSCFLLGYAFFASPAGLRGQTTFQRQLDSLNGLFCLEQTTDGNFWIGAFLGKLLRLDASGNLLNGYQLRQGDTASARYVYDLARAPGSGVYALFDRSNQNTALDDWLILARLDETGQPLWQTTAHYGEVQHWAHNRIATDPEGNVYAMSLRTEFQQGGGATSNKIILTKVSPNGLVVWTRRLSNDGLSYPRALLYLSDGSLLICGNAQRAASFGFILRVSSNGEVLQAWRSAQFLFKAAAEMPDGSWAFAATETGPLPQTTCVLRISPTGDLIWARRLEIPNALNWIPALTATPAGEITIGNYETPGGQPTADLIGLYADGRLKWARRFDLCYSYGVSAIINTLDGGLAALRFRPGGQLFLKTDAAGNCAACPATDVAPALTPVAGGFILDNWQSESASAPPAAATGFLPFSVPVRDYCGQTPPVGGMQLSDDTLCVFEPLSALAYGPGVADSYNWTFPGGTPATANGKTVNGVVFPLPGAREITLISKAGFCRDTFRQRIVTLDGPRRFELGPDTTLCGALATLTLDARTPGALQYFWENGAADSIRTIAAPGRYIATALAGACRQSDTIEVQVLTDFQVNLPADTTLCGADTIWLDATTPGANAYRWNDGLETARRPVFRSGIYAVTAYRTPCTAADLVSVDWFPSPPPLPADTVICAGERLVLSVGGSLAGQIWWNDEPGAATFEAEGPGRIRRRIEYRQCRFEDETLLRQVECLDGFAVYAPNAIAPESGGDNAWFTLFGPGLEIQTLRIFDRWGNLLFEQTGAPDARWDGRVAGNRALPGVYLWTAQLRQNGKEGLLKGAVTVVR